MAASVKNSARPVALLTQGRLQRGIHCVTRNATAHFSRRAGHARSVAHPLASNRPNPVSITCCRPPVSIECWSSAATWQLRTRCWEWDETAPRLPHRPFSTSSVAAQRPSGGYRLSVADIEHVLRPTAEVRTAKSQKESLPDVDRGGDVVVRRSSDELLSVPTVSAQLLRDDQPSVPTTEAISARENVVNPTSEVRSMNEKLRDCIWGCQLLAAREHAEAGDFAASLECAKAVLKQPDIVTKHGGRLHWQAWHVVGFSNTALGRPAIACEAFRKAIELWETDRLQPDPAGLVPQLLQDYGQAIAGVAAPSACIAATAPSQL